MVHDARSIALRLPKDGGESVRLTYGPAGQAMGDSYRGSCHHSRIGQASSLPCMVV